MGEIFSCKGEEVNNKFLGTRKRSANLLFLRRFPHILVLPHRGAGEGGGGEGAAEDGRAHQGAEADGGKAGSALHQRRALKKTK